MKVFCLVFSFIILCFSSDGQNPCSCNPFLGCELFLMRHYHKINGHPAFNGKQLMGDPYCINIEFPGNINIVSDGSEASELELAWFSCCGTNDFGNIVLHQTDELGNVIGNSDPDNYGVFTKINHSGNASTFRFKHPRKLPMDGEISGIMNVDIYNPIGGIIMGKIKIHYYRPPVAMVHGLWGVPSGFNDMEDQMVSSNNYLIDLLKKVDYSSTHASYFSTNQYVVETAVEELISACAKLDIAAGKSDIVCHSMGGLLSRTYIQSPAYASRKDVNKLITCNTPHAGSQFANFLLDSTQFSQVISDAMESQAFFCSKGAVNDLKVNNPPINTICYGNPTDDVRLHAVATIDPSGLPISWTLSVIQYLSVQLFLLNLVHTCVGDFLADVFNDDFHDAIVAVESQSGGLTGPKTFTVNNQIHIESVANTEVIDHVLDALNAPYNDPFFGSHYSGMLLNYSLYVPCLLFRDDTKITNRMNPAVDILFPAFDSIVTAGDTLRISYNTTMLDSVAAVIKFDNDSLAVLGNAAAAGVLNMPVHPATFGKQTLLLLGFDANKKVKTMDTVTLNFTTSATLDSISLYPSVFYLNQYDTTTFSVSGHYSDGRIRNITKDPNLVFDFEMDNVIRHNQHYLKMNGLADDTLYVSKGAITSDTILINKVGTNFPPNCHLVTNTNNNGIGSLKSALECVAPNDTILFDPLIVGDTIFIDSISLDIEKSLNIINTNAGKIIIKSGLYTVINIFSGTDIRLENILLISSNPSHVCINNYGDLSLKDVECRTLDQEKAAILNEQNGTIELIGNNIFR